jgi:hypothetical protein
MMCQDVEDRRSIRERKLINAFLVQFRCGYPVLPVANRAGNWPRQVQEIFYLRIDPITGVFDRDETSTQKKLWHTNLYIQPWQPPLVEETDTLKVLMAL